jgi:hypothetical protein
VSPALIAGAWLAFASAFFAIVALWCSFLISRMLPTDYENRAYWHADLARGVSSIARDAFAFLACVVFFWHLVAS